MAGIHWEDVGRSLIVSPGSMNEFKGTLVSVMLPVKFNKFGLQRVTLQCKSPHRNWE